MATSPTIVVKGKDEASAVLTNVGNKLDRMQQPVNRLGTAFGSVSKQLDGMSAPVARLAGAFGALGGSLAITSILGGLRQVVGALDDLDEASQAVGVAAVALAEFRLAASQSGVGTEKLDASLTKLNVKMADAASGGKESAAAFKALGINVKDSAGNLKSTEEVLGEVANKFQGFRDGAEKSALAVALFGKAGAAMVPFLNQGADGLRKFAGVTEESVLAARKLQGEIDKLSGSTQAFVQTLAGGIIPRLNDLIEIAGRINFGRAFSRGNPALVLADIAVQAANSAQKTAAANDALINYAAEYSNEGRRYLQIAPLIAKDTELRKEKTEAISESRQALARYIEQLDKQRQKLENISEALKALRFLQANPLIDTPPVRELVLLLAKANDELGEQKQIREHLLEIARKEEIAAEKRRDAKDKAGVDEFRILEENNRRLRDLTGQADQDRIKRDQAILDRAIYAGEVTEAQAIRAQRAIYGLGDAISETAELSVALGDTLANALGSLIVDPTQRDFFKNLERQLVSVTTQLLVIEPLIKRIRAAATGATDVAGAFDISTFIGGLFDGFNADGGYIRPGPLRHRG